MFIISELSEASFAVSKRDLLLRELLLVRSPSIPPIMYLFVDCECFARPILRGCVFLGGGHVVEFIEQVRPLIL